ncbi:hypothetical protein CQ13_12615 [Bradyrhizobium retamae]|uniref:Rhodanese domain-containing protein n=1 Tax=Bradyrhizobium retamae TaxID=1300035 RepID=A0A0R3MAA6_9BRAD|nr:hypothetical protein CQ13_12615 [Bradyrhizobium retamae]
MREALAGLILATFPFIVSTFAQERPPEPDGYRMEDYRAPVPATLAGVRVLTTAEAEAIWRAKAGAFIDVMPRVPKPQNLPEGTIWRDQPRVNIPGSVWLPDTGYGKLAAATEAYLRRGLVRATAGNNAALVVVYCLADCWMSWNAAKRILTWLFQRGVVSGRDRRLGAGRSGAGRVATGAANARGDRIAALATIRSPAESFVRGQTAAGRSSSAPRRRT